MGHTTPYQQAINAVAEWLDGVGASYVTKVADKSRRRMSASWEMQTPGSPLKSVHLVLPEDFPASCARIYADKTLCLQLPHIEEDGRLCLGVTPSPADYLQPCDAVARVLRALDEFLVNAANPQWVTAEFQKERLSYWLRFCERERRAPNARPTARMNLLCLEEFAGHAQGTLAIYADKGSNKRPQVMVACLDDTDPHKLAQRHRWAAGTLANGQALYVQIPAEQSWTPTTWPRSFHELEAMVAAMTAHQVSLREWIEAKRDVKPQSFLVVFVEPGAAYGYQIHPADVWRLQLPHVQPVPITRVDAAWALARDHGVDALARRRSKRVLVLGCGSLGSPVIELLARAGVGHLEILDKDFFDAENCSRHMLGLSALRRSKASKLTERLLAELPGVDIKAHVADATAWIARPRSADPAEQFELVVDCTAESNVRTALAEYRDIAFPNCTIIHAWLEPFCAAAHVVSIHAPDEWPMDDPVDQYINAAEWPDATRVNLPACGAGFHPYGAADAMQAAAFTAERVLAELDGTVRDSTIWSWVRSEAFFATLGAGAITREIVPRDASRFDSTMLTRGYRETVPQYDE